MPFALGSVVSTQPRGPLSNMGRTLRAQRGMGGKMTKSALVAGGPLWGGPNDESIPKFTRQWRVQMTNGGGRQSGVRDLRSQASSLQPCYSAKWRSAASLRSTSKPAVEAAGEKQDGVAGNASVPGISSEKVACPLFPSSFFLPLTDPPIRSVAGTQCQGPCRSSA